ncbi:MAG: NYN domain-containing protein [Azoarcus sp.]|jgi:uncharacterized protein (TIGR00288 family)|nr:NYN domain-containing protein [Azoarcus sp.]
MNMKDISSANPEPRTAVLVDCDNVSPDILEYALLMAAQFGRIVLRRGYGNQNTLSNKWQTALVQQAFTPCLQFQYASGKNTADIALALDAQEALFDERVDSFCLVTSDSDFTYLCRKLRERGAIVCIIGEAKTPNPLRNACDQFFEWQAETVGMETNVKITVKPEQTDAKKITAKPAKLAVTAKPAEPAAAAKPAEPAIAAKPAKPAVAAKPAEPAIKARPLTVVKAVSQLVNNSSEGKVDLSALGQYLKRIDSSFSAQKYGHSSLLNMIKTYDLLIVNLEKNTHWVSLSPKAETSNNKEETSHAAP